MGDVLPRVLRDRLKRCIAVMNVKGGVGKTSLMVNVGLLLAAALEYRVLLVEFDPQTHEGAGGNMGDDLGYAGDPSIDDDGLELASAILEGRPVKPKSGIRVRVDVVPGGNHLKQISDHLHRHDDEFAAGALARVLAPIAHEYDFVFIDCPPGDDQMQTAALGAARWLVSPTKADKSSRKGLVSAGRKFQEILDYNPEIELMGVVLFAMPTAARSIRQQVMQSIQEAFAGSAPILGTTVRAAEAPAFEARERGLAIHEMTSAGRARGGRGLRSQIMKGAREDEQPQSEQDERTPRRFPRSSTPLANDYAHIAEDIETRILQTEGAA